MSDASKIEWTDATWNPVTGCTKVSPGCDHCYAETFAERWRGTPGHHFEQGFDLTLRHERLDQPLRWSRPRMVFVNSMSDLFHDDIPDDFIAKVFAVMAAARQHTFQLLTKRHGRMRSLLNNDQWRSDVFQRESLLDFGRPRRLAGLDPDRELPVWPLPNVWLGVSVESQKWANIRIPALLTTPAAVRWVSCEPLLGPLNLNWCDGLNALQPDCTSNMGAPHPMLDWVVAGGESGPGARPMHPDWARALRDQCQTAGVPYFFKQWGEWEPIGPLYGDGDDEQEADEARMEAVGLEVVEGKRVIEVERSGYIVEGHQPGDPRTWLMARVGKKAAGRKLDGRTHDAYPRAVEAVNA